MSSLKYQTLPLRTRLALRMRRGDSWLRLAMIGLLIPTFYPFVALLFLSFKDNPQFYHNRWLLSFPLHFGNYTYALKTVSPYILNSIISSGVTVVGVLLLASLAAYAFSRGDFPGKEGLFYLILSLLMVPGILTLIARFVLVKQLGLLNSRWALILPWISSGQVFAIFLLRSFFDQVPEDLFESARLDGANEFQILLQIALPLARPIMGVVAVLNITGTWNDLIWPLVTIMNNQTLYTIPIGLTLFRQAFWTNWGPLFAGYVIVSIPMLVFFVFSSKLFIRGIASGAIKM